MFQTLKQLWAPRQSLSAQTIRAHYARIVASAREPLLFQALAVPDTVDGRFDCLVLHVHLWLRALKGSQTAPKTLSQQLFDLFLTDMDHNLRELGVSDLRVGPQVKSMAKGYYGRATAYDAALDSGDDRTLDAALRRNLYGALREPPPDAAVTAMVRYIGSVSAHLAVQDFTDVPVAPPPPPLTPTHGSGEGS
jgi:cytochrome b pre-mRNA-processing protein 3